MKFAQLALAATLALAPALVHADTITFEGYAGFTDLNNQYASLGVTFSNAVVLQAPGYNYPGYPPHSGTNVIYYAVDPLTIDFALPQTNASFWYTSGSSDEVKVYNNSGTLLQDVSVDSNYGTDSLFSIASGATRVIVTNDPNGFTMDDLTVSNTPAVPEPGSLALLGTGLLGGIGSLRRKLNR